MIYNNLNVYYNALHKSVKKSYSNEIIKMRINDLSFYIHENAQTLMKDLSANGAHVRLYEKINADIRRLDGYTGKELIKQIEWIKYNAELLKLQLLNQDLDKLAFWLNQHQKTVTINKIDFGSHLTKVLYAFDKVSQPKKFSADFVNTLSKMALFSLSFSRASLFENSNIDVRVVGHFVNAKEIPLKDLGLSVGELSLLAPYLHYVDCRDIPFKDDDEVKKFINCCSNARQLLINSDKIEGFFVLPKGLEKLDCSDCLFLEVVCTAGHTSLKEITLSNLPALSLLDCRGCTSLITLTLSNLLSLKNLEFFDCTSLIKLKISNLINLKELKCSHQYSLMVLELSNLISLNRLSCERCASLKEFTFSNLTSLEHLNLLGCRSIKELELSNLTALNFVCCLVCDSIKVLTLTNLTSLENIDLSSCSSLESLTLSNLEALQKLNCKKLPLKVVTLSNLLNLKELDCTRCTFLKELLISNLAALEKLICEECSRLENISAQSLPSCRYLIHNGCPRLRQLPQIRRGAFVVSHGSINFISFEVDPKDLKKQPLGVLCRLGKIILRDQRMPNVVFLNSPGIDEGGVRRQLVTTLLKNLFEKGSPFAAAEEGVEGVLPRLSNLNDEKQGFAFKALGALVALASLGSLPLGRHFRDNFYYALLNSDDESEVKIYRLLHALPEGDAVTPEEIKGCLSLIRPIALAAKEFKNIVGNDHLKWLRELGLKNFITDVAGEEISLVAFERKVDYRGDSGDILKTQGFFQQFFNEHAPEKLADMIELFTGSRALGIEIIQIHIMREKDEESLFEMSTCFSQVTIPVYASYEKFKGKLFQTAEYVLGRFDKA